jgi:hypothetical protein
MERRLVSSRKVAVARISKFSEKAAIEILYETGRAFLCTDA